MTRLVKKMRKVNDYGITHTRVLSEEYVSQANGNNRGRVLNKVKYNGGSILQIEIMKHS